MSKITAKQWLDIKTRYQLGDAINKIARDFLIPESTIRARKNKEGWTQELRTQLTDVTNKISQIANVCEPSQIPIIQERLSAQLQLMEVAEDFISMAANMNLQALKDLQQEDTRTKIMGLSTLKATIPELVKLVGLQKTIEEKQAEEDSDKAGITINVCGVNDIINATPEEIEAKYHALVKEGKITKYRITDEMSAMEASRVYQEFINEGKDD